MSVSGDIAAHAHEARSVIKSQDATWSLTVLHGLIFAHRSQVVSTAFTHREKAFHLLRHRLHTEVGWLHQELRQVWPRNVAVAGIELSAEQVLRRDRVGKYTVVAADVRHAVQVGGGLRCQRTASVVGEVDIAHQRGPIMLHLLSRCLRAGYAGRGRNVGGVRVQSFQVVGEGSHRTIEGRGECRSSRISGDDVFEVVEVAGLQGMKHASVSGIIRDAQGVMLQALAPVAAVIGEALGITVVRQFADVDVVVLRSVLAIFVAGAGARSWSRSSRPKLQPVRACLPAEVPKEYPPLMPRQSLLPSCPEMNDGWRPKTHLGCCVESPF